MTDDEKAFLAHFDATPDDVAPHHMYADWLEERGRDDEAAYQRRWTAEIGKAERWLRKWRCWSLVTGIEVTTIESTATGAVFGCSC